MSKGNGNLYRCQWPFNPLYITPLTSWLHCQLYTTDAQLLREYYSIVWPPPSTVAVSTDISRIRLYSWLNKNYEGRIKLHAFRKRQQLTKKQVNQKAKRSPLEATRHNINQRPATIVNMQHYQMTTTTGLVGFSDEGLALNRHHTTQTI